MKLNQRAERFMKKNKSKLSRREIKELIQIYEDNYVEIPEDNEAMSFDEIINNLQEKSSHAKKVFEDNIAEEQYNQGKTEYEKIQESLDIMYNGAESKYLASEGSMNIHPFKRKYESAVETIQKKIIDQYKAEFYPGDNIYSYMKKEKIRQIDASRKIIPTLKINEIQNSGEILGINLFAIASSALLIVFSMLSLPLYIYMIIPTGLAIFLTYVILGIFKWRKFLKLFNKAKQNLRNIENELENNRSFGNTMIRVGKRNNKEIDIEDLLKKFDEVKKESESSWA